MPSLAASCCRSRSSAAKTSARIIHQVHLVDGGYDVARPQQRGDVGVTARLGQDAFARIDQDDGHVGGRRAGSHVARVLLVPRRVGDDELAMGGGEVAVGDIDGDALLPLRAQAVGKLGKIDRARDIRRWPLWSRRAHDLRRRSASRTAAGRSASTCHHPRCPRC